PDMLDDIRAFLEQQRLYGVLILPPISENDALAALFGDVGCGCVRMGSAQLDDEGHLVESNDCQAVGNAIDYLVEQGHRRIALIAGPDGFRSAQERRKAFREAMARHGLDCGPELIAQGNYTFETGRAAAERLLEASPRPSEIFAGNEEMPAGGLHAARQGELDVPHDLPLVGFDDSAMAAQIWPPM